jgi:hypothetical protein
VCAKNIISAKFQHKEPYEDPRIKGPETFVEYCIYIQTIQCLIFLYPTRIPSSISVGETVSARSTTNFANCFTLIIYLASSLPSLIIFVQRATCNGCSPRKKTNIKFKEKNK